MLSWQTVHGLTMLVSIIIYFYVLNLTVWQTVQVCTGLNVNRIWTDTFGSSNAHIYMEHQTTSSEGPSHLQRIWFPQPSVHTPHIIHRHSKPDPTCSPIYTHKQMCQLVESIASVAAWVDKAHQYIHISDVKSINMLSIRIDTCRYRKVSIPNNGIDKVSIPSWWYDNCYSY